MKSIGGLRLKEFSRSEERNEAVQDSEVPLGLLKRGARVAPVLILFLYQENSWRQLGKKSGRYTSKIIAEERTGLGIRKQELVRKSFNQPDVARGNNVTEG